MTSGFDELKNVFRLTSEGASLYEGMFKLKPDEGVLLDVPVEFILSSRQFQEAKLGSEWKQDGRMGITPTLILFAKGKRKAPGGAVCYLDSLESVRERPELRAIEISWGRHIDCLKIVRLRTDEHSGSLVRYIDRLARRPNKWYI